MDLLEHVAKKMHCFLSDFHYVSKVLEAREILFDLIEVYTLEEWLEAYTYIFDDQKPPLYFTSREVFHGLYQRLMSEGTPYDTIEMEKRQGNRCKWQKFKKRRIKK